MIQLPVRQAELAEIQPQADAAAEEVAELKALRKALREEKSSLEKLVAETQTNAEADL